MFQNTNVLTLTSAQTLLKGGNWRENFFKTLVRYEVFTQNLDNEVMM